MNTIRKIGLPATLFVLALAAYPQNAATESRTTLRRLGQAVQQLAEQARPAIVQVSVRGFSSGEGMEPQVRAVSGIGSGFIVDPAGYIVTNAHVVGGARKVEVLIPRPKSDVAGFRSAVRPFGRSVFADVVGYDRETDIAVLKVAQTGLPSLSFADSDLVRQGDLVLAAGSPLGLENSVTMGVVSSVARQLRPDDPMVYIQTDASINPGNSGGPLIDADGAVVGINTMIASQSGGSEGIGFSVPSNIARTIYEQIRKEGRVRRGYIGVVAQTITPALAEGLHLSQDWGVIVADVSPGSAAEAAGIEIKDIVLTLDGKPMENARQFGVSIYRHPGQSVTLELLRGGQKISKQVSVLERPRDPERLGALIQGEANRVPQLGVLAVDLDEKVTPILAGTRKLAGAVVAGADSEPRYKGDPLMPGDVIYEVNGKSVGGVADLKAAIGSFAAGQAVVVQIERLGQMQLLTLRLE